MKAPALAALLLAMPAAAQEAYPKVIPAPGGNVVVPTASAQAAMDGYHYAPARRAGDHVYISGVIVGRLEGGGKDVAAFQARARRIFTYIDTMLKAEGASFADVVLINSFHVWNSPDFDGDMAAQFAALSAVKDEFMVPPYPAWTAVGTTGLLDPHGIVEIQMIAYAPVKKP